MVELDQERFPVAAGIFLGLGLGGFFDGIVLHQILQWHHMVTSAGYPPDTVANLKLNTLLDGLFHASTYVFIVIGLILLWRTSRKAHLWWSSKMLTGTILIGFGAFNVVEGMSTAERFPASVAEQKQASGARMGRDAKGPDRAPSHLGVVNLLTVTAG